MKKIIALVAVAVLAFVGYQGYKYYSETYASDLAYAIVPAEVPEKLPTKDMNGDTVDGLYSYNYDLTFVKEDGSTQKMSFEVSSEDPTPLEPNTYISAEISLKRMTKGPNPVIEKDIPEKALAKLKG